MGARMCPGRHKPAARLIACALGALAVLQVGRARAAPADASQRAVVPAEQPGAAPRAPRAPRIEAAPEAPGPVALIDPSGADDDLVDPQPGQPAPGPDDPLAGFAGDRAFLRSRSNSFILF